MYKIITIIIAVLFLGYALATYIPNKLNAATPNFPVATDIVIEEGMTHRDITNLLEDKEVVRSSLYLHYVLSQKFDGLYVKAGIYNFDSPRTTYEVAQIITSGANTSPLLAVTFPEGFSTKDIATYLPPLFTNPDVSTITKFEGYLFPDTYYISKDSTFTDLVTLMQRTFDEKIQTVAGKISASGLTQDEVIILASLIEREARDVHSKKIVAGILRNRLRIDMPLQVDATFMYILGKTSAQLTQDDLRIDSPYNTYTNTGLPPTPISNPGMESILAVLEPQESEYLYYLTDDAGTFRYAKTFEEHKVNKSRYLR